MMAQPVPHQAEESQTTDKKRVKVYELRSNDWFDRGTGFCTASFIPVRVHHSVADRRLSLLRRLGVLTDGCTGSRGAAERGSRDRRIRGPTRQALARDKNH